MPFNVKLAIFFVLLLGAVYLLHRNPHWKISQLAYSWHGPAPAEGETYVHYLLRWAGYAGLHALAFLAAISLSLALGYDRNNAPMWLSAIVNFALPFGVMMAVAGALGCLVKAGWLTVFGRKRVFQESTGDFTDAA